MAWNILRTVPLQFTGIFYLHLPSYSSLAKTWLPIRNRISPLLYVLYIPLYRMIDFCFGFLSESIDCEQKSLDFEELEIEANAVIWLISGTGNPGWSRTRPELACCEATISLLHRMRKENQTDSDWPLYFLIFWFSVYLTIIRRRRS